MLSPMRLYARDEKQNQRGGLRNTECEEIRVQDKRQSNRIEVISNIYLYLFPYLP